MCLMMVGTTLSEWGANLILDPICSYRSELFGMYLSLLIVQQICQKYKLRSGGITIGCDNICRRFGMSCEGACSYTSMWQLLSGLNC